MKDLHEACNAISKGSLYHYGFGISEIENHNRAIDKVQRLLDSGVPEDA